jgi:hypothetical protein
MGYLYLEAQWRGHQAAPSLETMLDMLGKSPDMGRFLHGVFSIRGEPGMCEGA